MKPKSGRRHYWSLLVCDLMLVGGERRAFEVDKCEKEQTGVVVPKVLARIIGLNPSGTGFSHRLDQHRDSKHLTTGYYERMHCNSATSELDRCPDLGHKRLNVIQKCPPVHRYRGQCPPCLFLRWSASWTESVAAPEVAMHGQRRLSKGNPYLLIRPCTTIKSAPNSFLYPDSRHGEMLPGKPRSRRGPSIVGSMSLFRRIYRCPRWLEPRDRKPRAVRRPRMRRCPTA